MQEKSGRQNICHVTVGKCQAKNANINEISKTRVRLAIDQ